MTQTIERLYGLSADACPDGRDSATVVFGDQDSGVPNPHRGGGCTFLDAVWAEEPFRNHGRFVRTVRGLAEQWRDEGLFTRTEVNLVHVAAARSGIARGGPPAGR